MRTEPNQDNINLVSPVTAKVDFFTSYNIYGPTISAFSMTEYILTSHFSEVITTKTMRKY
jgi:hypothetical protein